MPWPFGSSSSQPKISTSARRRSGWVGWIAQVFWRKHKAAGEGSEQKKATPAVVEPQRPRFTESLESRRMLTASGPVSFALPVFYNTIAANIAAGDFNHDGKPDLVGTDGTNSIVHVLLNNGDGTFSAGQNFYVPSVRDVTVADFNGDGNLDFAVLEPNGLQSSVDIFFGKGDGTFFTPAKHIPIAFPVNALASGDLNGDGLPDLFITIANRMLVLLNKGNEEFHAPVPYNCGGKQTGQIVVGDFNGDGIPDVAVTRTNIPQVAILLGQKNADGTPTGTLGKAVLINLGTNAHNLTVGDFNGDGKLDIAVANSDFKKPALEVLIGNGDGTFAKPQYYYGGNFVQDVAAGDFTGNGIEDLATVSFTSDVRAYPGNGDGTFGAVEDIPTFGFGETIISADFNGDGKDDLAIGTGFGIRVFISTSQVAPPPTTNTLSVTLGAGASSITYKDASGPKATLTLSGPGAATIVFSGPNLSLNSTGTQIVGGSASIQSINVTGTTAATGFSEMLATRNGSINIGSFTADGAFGIINAPTANLVGNLTLGGPGKSITLNNLHGGTVSIGAGASSVNLNFANVSDESMTSAQPINSLSVGQWNSVDGTSEQISAPSINSISVFSTFSPDLSLNAGGLKSFNARFITGGTWTIAGAVNSIFVSRNVQFSLSAPTLGTLTAGGILDGVTLDTSGDIHSISAAGLINSTIEAGVGPLPPDQRLPASAGDFISSAKIFAVTLREGYVAASFLNSSIAAAALGNMSLGIISFANGGETQGLAAQSITSFSGADFVTKKTFGLVHPVSLSSLTNRGINTADFVLTII